MSDKKDYTPFLFAGGVGVLVWLALRGGKKTESTGITPNVTTSEGEVSAWVPDDKGPPVGMPSPFREITKETATPGAFAIKYSGSFSRWKEIAIANPELFLVDQPSACRKTAENPDGVGSCYATKEKRSDGQPVYIYGFQTIAPWQLGQMVRLPDGWKG
jgi:hypothetical protein